MSLSLGQQSIRHLVDEWSAADAMVAYYAFHDDAAKRYLVTSPPAAVRAEGFVTISRTGIDLFRPLLTMRLPIHDLAQSRELLMQALPPGQEAFAAVPKSHLPLMRALCEMQSEEPLNLYALPAERFKPLINVLVMREDEQEMPRFVVKQVVNGQRMVVAAAGLNWLSPRFGEIAVQTRPEYRQKGFGRAVVGALAEYLLAHGRMPLYAVNPSNAPSIHLAESLGFVDTAVREWMLEVRMRGEG